MEKISLVQLHWTITEVLHTSVQHYYYPYEITISSQRNYIYIYGRNIIIQNHCIFYSKCILNIPDSEVFILESRDISV